MALSPQSVPVKTLAVGLLALLVMGRFGFQKGKSLLGDLGRGSGDGSGPLLLGGIHKMKVRTGIPVASS